MLVCHSVKAIKKSEGVSNKMWTRILIYENQILAPDLVLPV